MANKRANTVRLQTLTKAFWESAALMSAIELGLFTAIDGGARTAAAVAEAIGISARNAERLLVALTAMDLVALNDGQFTNAEDVDRFLVEGKPSYAGPWMLFGKPRWNEWGRLTEHLRDGDERRLGMYVDFTSEAARRYHQATYSIGMGAARLFHRQVDLTGRRQLIDLGGGSGCYCIVAAQNHPELRATVLDLPQVVPVAREFIAENGVADRVDAQACDFTADALPEGADVAIMASNLPQYDGDIIAAVIAKVFAALQPGGEFHLIGEMLDDDRSGPIAPALWGLSEALSHSTGGAHTVGECLAHFAAAGFRDVKAVEFIPQTLTRVTGFKPV